MKKSNNRVSAEVKTAVMMELSKPESGVRHISREYGVSRATIYSWLREERAMKGGAYDSSTSNNDSVGFVELSVEESVVHSSLTNVLLVFEDYSLSLEGRVSSSKLISIIKILEVSC